MARENIFAGISFTPSSQLETDPEKLNPYKGVIKSLGGIIQGYQDQAEQTKFSNFNKALTNFQREGNTDAIKALTDYSTEFTDPKLREQALSSSTTAFDSTALGSFNQKLLKAQQTGDFTDLSVPTTFDPAKAQMSSKSLTEAFNRNTLGKLELSALQAQQAQDPVALKSILDQGLADPSLDAGSKAAFVSKYGTLLPDLEANALARKYFTEYTTTAKEPTENISIYQRLFQSNPTFTQALELKDGNLVPKQVQTSEVDTLLSNQGIAKDSLNYDSEFKKASDKLTFDRNNVANTFFSLAAQQGAKPATANIDAFEKKLRSEFFNKNIPIDKAENLVKVMTGLAQAQTSLGQAAKANLDRTLATLDAEAATKISELEELKKIQTAGAFTQRDIVDRLSKGSEDYLKALSNTTNDWIIGGANRTEAVKYIQENLKGAKFKDSTGKEVPATLRDIAIAITSGSAPVSSWSFAGDNKPYIDLNNLKTSLVQVIGASEDYDKFLNNTEIINNLKAYNKRINEIKTQNTLEKFKAQQRASAEAGNPQSFSSAGLKQAAQTFNEAASRITSQSTSTGDSLVEREGNKPNLYNDTSGNPTIGVGHKLLPEELQGGYVVIGSNKVPVKDSSGNNIPLSPENIQALYQQDRQKHDTTIINDIGENVWNSLAPNQQSALSSYAFNVGSLKGLSGIKEALQNKNYTKAADIIRNGIVTSNSKTQDFLVKRRRQEAEEFLGKSTTTTAEDSLKETAKQATPRKPIALKDKLDMLQGEVDRLGAIRDFRVTANQLSPEFKASQTLKKALKTAQTNPSSLDEDTFKQLLKQSQKFN